MIEPTDYDIQELNRLRRKVDGLRGSGGGLTVTNTYDSISMVFVPEKKVILPAGAPQNSTITFFITSDASGNGYYNAKSYTDPATLPDGSSNIASSDLGTLSSTEDCIVANLAEVGVSSTGHGVTGATNTAQFSIYGIGRFIGVNANGKKVIETYMTYAGCS